MVLKPPPWNVPVKAASGPRPGTEEALSLNEVRLDTSPNLKSLGCNNDGRTWSPRTTFRTGKSGVRDFRFCATGDEDTYTTSSEPVMESIASFDPDFTIVAGSEDGTHWCRRPFRNPAWPSGVGQGSGTETPWTRTRTIGLTVLSITR